MAKFLFAQLANLNYLYSRNQIKVKPKIKRKMEEKSIKVVELKTYCNGSEVMTTNKIETEESYEKVLAFCIDFFKPTGLEKPAFDKAYQEACKNDRFNDMMRIDANGWYTLTKTDASSYVFETSNKIIK